MSRVRSVELFLVEPFFLLVRIEDDDGVVGWGEAGVQTHATAVMSAIKYLAEDLRYQDVFATNQAWERMHKTRFYRGGPVLQAAISALDIALWDLKARALSLPIFELLGGPVRSVMPAYKWLGTDTTSDTPESLAQDAIRATNDGFHCLKLTIPRTRPGSYSHAILRLRDAVSAIRVAVGEDVDIAVDCHGRCTPAQAVSIVDELRPYGILFIEEPLLPVFLDRMKDLVLRSSVPIAAGERAYDRWEASMLASTGVAFLQPDIAQCGGFTEMMRIAAIASAHGATLAPHCAIGPVALAASLQFGFAVPDVAIQEYPVYPQVDEVFFEIVSNSEVLRPRAGQFDRSLKPGLGIDINEDYVRRKAVEARSWIPPQWEHEDGLIAEW